MPQFYRSGDVRLAYEQRLPPGGRAERTAVLVHGWCGRADGWAPTMARLPAHYRSLAPQLRGHGDSDRPAGGYSIAQYARDVFALFEAEALHDVDLIGQSMGGAVALQLALDHPQRLRSLTLISPVPAGGLAHGGPDSVEVRRAARTDRDVARWMVRAYSIRPLAPEWIERGADSIMGCSDGHFWQSLDSIEQLRLGHRLHELALPTLLIMGDHDRVIPLASVVAMAQAIPDCGLQVFWNVSHSPPAEAPDAFAAVLLDFLAHGNLPRAWEPPPLPPSL